MPDLTPMLLPALGYLAAFLIGGSLGLVGGGGSILALPVLVYLLHIPPVTATADSLFIIGITSLAGALRSMWKGQLSYRIALIFTLPSISAVWLTRHFLLPDMPQVLWRFQGRDLTADIAFAISLLLGVILAAFFLLRREMREQPSAGRVALLMLPAAATVFAIRQFLIPNLPEHWITLHGFAVTRDRFLMLVFALVMLGAAQAMLRRPKEDRPPKPGEELESKASPQREKALSLRLGFQGLLVGAVTGLVGAGGGFLIVPGLVLLAGLSMRRAVGTSMLIITINSLVGFVGNVSHDPPDWSLLLPFTTLAIMGLLIGSAWADSIPNRILRRGFGMGLAVLGCAILIKEIVFG